MADPGTHVEGADPPSDPSLSERRRPGGSGGPGARRPPGPGSPERAVRAVLFDLDDTLFDHTRALTEGLRTLRGAEPLLRRRPFAEVLGEYERLLDEIQPGPPPAPASHAEARARRFVALARWLGAPPDPEVAEGWSTSYRAAYQANRHPLPGAIALLRGLAGEARLGIVTNNHTAEQEEKLRLLGMGRWIDFMITSEGAGWTKPDPRIFQLALERAGCGPEEAVMVGDSWVSDVEGAVAAGIPAVWLNRWGERRALPPRVHAIGSLRPLAQVRSLLLRGGGSRPPRATPTARAAGYLTK